MSRECCSAACMRYQVYCVGGVSFEACLLIWAACCIKEMQQPHPSCGVPAHSAVCCQLKQCKPSPAGTLGRAWLTGVRNTGLQRSPLREVT